MTAYKISKFVYSICISFLQNKLFYSFYNFFSCQTHKQYIFQAGEVSRNWGIPKKVSLWHTKEGSWRENILVFFLSKTTIRLRFKWEFNPQMHIYRTFFPKIRTLQNQGTFFPCFEIEQGRSSPIPLVMHLLALIIE